MEVLLLLVVVVMVVVVLMMVVMLAAVAAVYGNDINDDVAIFFLPLLSRDGDILWWVR